MRQAKLSILLAASILVSLACMLITELPRVLPIDEPTPSPVESDTPTTVPSPIHTATLTSLPPTFLPPTIPVWVTNFSDPILTALADRRPDILDEFSPYNQGWFFVNPVNSQRPFYADVMDGTLFLNLPEGTIDKDLMVYNPKLRFRNFVLNFDFKFGKTEPDDVLSFQFGRTADDNVALDLSRNESWTYYWTLHGGPQSSSGAYDYFSPEYLNVIIIMRGNECAIYLNHDPVDYLSECRPEPNLKLTATSLSFHLLGTGRPASVMMDNVKAWDLDRLP